MIVNVGGNCGTRHRNLLWRGAAAVALTRLLEEAGYRVELWAAVKVTRVWQRKDKFDTAVMDAVCLKRAGDPLDESTLISAVSGWFFRTVTFRGWCTGKHVVCSHLGCVVPVRGRNQYEDECYASGNCSTRPT